MLFVNVFSPTESFRNALPITKGNSTQRCQIVFIPYYPPHLRNSLKAPNFLPTTESSPKIMIQVSFLISQFPKRDIQIFVTEKNLGNLPYLLRTTQLKGKSAFTKKKDKKKTLFQRFPKAKLKKLHVIFNNCTQKLIRTRLNIKSYFYHLFC